MSLYLSFLLRMAKIFQFLQNILFSMQTFHRMLIRKCPVMIFDDSLSAVDAETDARIRAALRKDTGESTVILIAHRITTIMHADRIIVMDKGKVAEQGSHEELLARGGIYRRIYDLQMNGIGEEEWNV